MTESKEQKATHAMWPYAFLLTIVLASIKVGWVPTLSWWIVTAPLLLPFGFLFLVGSFIFLVTLAAGEK